MKKLSALLIAALLVLTLVPTMSTASELGGSISFYYWDINQKPGMDEVVALFNETSPNVQVESTAIPWSQYWTKLQTSIASVNGPDVFWLNYTHAIDFFPIGLAQEISSFIERDAVDMSHFPQSLIDMYSYDGKQYAVPKDYDTIALFYNKALFDAKGMAYPDDTWTWDQLKEAAIALTGDGIFGFAADQGGQTFVFPWVLSNDGLLINEDRTQVTLNNPNAIAAIEWMTDMMFVQKAAPTGMDIQELEAEMYFESGMAAMYPAGSWLVPPAYEALGDNLGVCRLPISKKPGNVIHGLGITISAMSQNVEAAWGLAKAFTTKEAGVAQANVVIPAYAGADEAWMANFPTLNLQCFIDAAQYAEPLPNPFIASAAQNDIVTATIETIFQQGKDVATAFADNDAACEAAVAAAGQ